jgi:hypothetical protein
LENVEKATKVKNPRNSLFRRLWTLLVGQVNRAIEDFESGEQIKKAAETPDQITANATKWMMRFTFVLAIIGILTLCVLRNQLKEMHEGGIDTKNLANAATEQAQWEQMLFIMSAIQAQNTHDLAIAAGKQADASKSMSDLAAKQFSTSQRVIESQRASISISPYSVDHPMTFQEHGMSFAFTLALTNNGAFVANDVRMRYKLYFSKFDKSIFTEPGKQQRTLCKPPVPPRIGNAPKLIIYQGNAAPEQINGGWGFVDLDVIQQPNDPQHPIGLIPIVVGCVDYLSGAMPEWHQTGFIYQIRSKDGIIPIKDIPINDIFIARYIFDQGDSY